jgi:hypothetical protein
MKKIILLLVISLFCNGIYSQNKHGLHSSVLAKSKNLTVELINNNLYLFVKLKKAKKDTILLRKNDLEVPSECKIDPFMAKGKKLYNVTWKQKTITNSKLINEVKTVTNSAICDISLKVVLFSNVQTNTKTKEIQFIDESHNASETHEKNRNEGLVLSVTKEGNLELKNKEVEKKMIYDSIYKKYINSESLSQIKKAK